MKAIILAAGRGTRLAPITNHTPKCLVDIGGKPLLQHWLDIFTTCGVSEVLINLSYLYKEVDKFLDKYQGSIVIHRAYEEILLGSAGTIRKNQDFVRNEKEFMIVYADNLTDMNLNHMVHYHRNKKSKFTIGLFESNRPKDCGIVTMNAMGLIEKYVEKPEQPESTLANAGIYIVDRSLLSIFQENSPYDIGKEVLPKLVGIMYGYYISSYFLDIGTKENYMKAVRDWSNMSKISIDK